MLILTIVACCYCIVIVAMWAGGLVYLGIPIAILGIAKLRKPSGVYSAHGTARWASLSDLLHAGMVGARRGPIIGKVMNNTKVSPWKAWNDLFSPRVSSKEACEQFFDSILIGRFKTSHL
jgi:hypothetical protein